MCWISLTLCFPSINLKPYKLKVLANPKQTLTLVHALPSPGSAGHVKLKVHQRGHSCFTNISWRPAWGYVGCWLLVIFAMHVLFRAAPVPWQSNISKAGINPKQLGIWNKYGLIWISIFLSYKRSTKLKPINNFTSNIELLSHMNGAALICFPTCDNAQGKKLACYDDTRNLFSCRWQNRQDSHNHRQLRFTVFAITCKNVRYSYRLVTGETLHHVGQSPSNLRQYNLYRAL